MNVCSVEGVYFYFIFFVILSVHIFRKYIKDCDINILSLFTTEQNRKKIVYLYERRDRVCCEQHTLSFGIK